MACVTEHIFKNDNWPKSQTGGNFNLTLWESKNDLTAQFSSKTITIYTVDFFFLLLYHRAVQCICSQRQNRGKIDTSYLVCIFFFFCLLPKYKTLSPFINVHRQDGTYKEAIVWQQTSVVHLKQIWCSPSHPPAWPAQAHKRLKNTRLSAGTSAKMSFLPT